VLHNERATGAAASREKPAEDGGSDGAEDSQRQYQLDGSVEILKTARSSRDLQNRDKENERDRKVDGEEMKATNELRPVRALRSVRWKKEQQREEQKDRR